MTEQAKKERFLRLVEQFSAEMEESPPPPPSAKALAYAHKVLERTG